MRKLLCMIFGHRLKPEIYPVGTNINIEPVWMPDEFGNSVGYYMRRCKRCRGRIPIDAENARRQAIISTEIGKVMNASRAQHGLRPLKWDVKWDA